MKDTGKAGRGQRWLPFVPADLAVLGLKDVDARPRCSMGRSAGFLDVKRRPGTVAWGTFRHVGHHGASSFNGIYLDVDRQWADVAPLFGERVPAPSVSVVRTSGTSAGHSQVAWLLAAPVHRYPEAKRRPLELLARTSEWFAEALESDGGYTGTLFRNGPVHAERAGWVVEYNGPPGGWTLTELADWVPAGWRRPGRNLRTAEGRNCSLFLSLCRFAGSAAGRRADLAGAAARMNAHFPAPLSAREVGHVVAHVERYRAGWEARGWHRPEWLARQAARGRAGGLKGGPASGAARRARTAERDRKIAEAIESGASYRAAARRFGVDVETAFRAARAGAAVEKRWGKANTR